MSAKGTTGRWRRILPSSRSAQKPSQRAVDRSAMHVGGQERARERLENMKLKLTRLSNRVDRQGERLKSQAERMKELERHVGALRTSYFVVESQMASMEVRLEQLEVRLDDEQPHSTDAERAEARSLLEEMRQEHRRARARLGVVGRYEERLRRIEKALEPTPGP